MQPRFRILYAGSAANMLCAKLYGQRSSISTHTSVNHTGKAKHRCQLQKAKVLATYIWFFLPLRGGVIDLTNVIGRPESVLCCRFYSQFDGLDLLMNVVIINHVPCSRRDSWLGVHSHSFNWKLGVCYSAVVWGVSRLGRQRFCSLHVVLF